MTHPEILKIENLSHRYEKKDKGVWSLLNVNLSVLKGKTLGIIGESGSGKSTLAKAIVRLISPTCGSILFNGHDLCKKSKRELKPYRQKIQFLFQNSDAALNPRMCVRDILSEPLEIHRDPAYSSREKYFKQLLALVHLDAYALKKYPHEFSGGQRQRINIIRALVVKPELLICDEPFSALDATTQVQMIALFQDLQKELHLSTILIGHDLPIVAHLSDDIAVMQGGQIIEKAPAVQLCKEPLHPYTKALFSAIPRLDFFRNLL